MATKSISQLTEVTSDLGTDKLEIAKVDALSASGYTSGSTTVDKLGAYINGIKTFSTLPTTDKTIVGSLSECFQSVSDGKTLIATAITDKGVQTLTPTTVYPEFLNLSTNGPLYLWFALVSSMKKLCPFDISSSIIFECSLVTLSSSSRVPRYFSFSPQYPRSILI